MFCVTTAKDYFALIMFSDLLLIILPHIFHFLKSNHIAQINLIILIRNRIINQLIRHSVSSRPSVSSSPVISATVRIISPKEKPNPADNNQYNYNKSNQLKQSLFIHLLLLA